MVFLFSFVGEMHNWSLIIFGCIIIPLQTSSITTGEACAVPRGAPRLWLRGLRGGCSGEASPILPQDLRPDTFRKVPEKNATGNFGEEGVGNDGRATENYGNGGSANGPDDDENGDKCALCCESTHHWAVGACGHRVVCNVCALRMRLLLNSTECVMCKQVQKYVVVTDAQRAFEDFDTSTMMLDSSAGIFYDNVLVYARMMELKSYNCVKCSAPHSSVKDLQVTFGNSCFPNSS